ncbi:MAG: hypothetical protein AB7O52_17005 [Planctomycetota bacterium]
MASLFRFTALTRWQGWLAGVTLLLAGTLSEPTALRGADCNGNGIDDALDLSSGTSADCNVNGIPDECDLGAWAGALTGETEIGDLTGGFGVDLDPFDRFGQAIASVGDLNGDGIPDIAVGAPGDDDGGSDQGAVYILLLAADGTVSSHTKIAEGQGGFTGPLDASDRFGSAVAAVGDVDQNGTVDLAVGATGDDDGASDAGAVYILFLAPGPAVSGFAKVSATQGSFMGTLAAFDFFGESLAALGDRDGNGVPDLAVGARGTDDGGMDRGAVWLLDLTNTGSVVAEHKISATSGAFAGVLDDLDGFGSSVAAVGDVDGDLVGDIAVGARLDDDGANDTGAVWILFLSPLGSVSGTQKISALAGNLPAGLSGGDAFGSAVGAPGDLNGDDIPDLLVGAPLDDDGGVGNFANRGAVWVLTLQPGGTVLGGQKISDTAGDFDGALIDTSSFGRSLQALADIDGDGHREIAVGAVGDFPTTGFGSLWLLFTAPAFADCNSNGTPDPCDIASGTSTDTDGDGTPDECSATATLVRGDCNVDGAENISDAVFLLGFLFPTGTPNAVTCSDACDANDDGGLNLADAVILLGSLFGQPPIPLRPPVGTCGVDPTADTLGCAAACP